MEEILSDIKSGRWWFSTVFVAITVSIIANIIWEFVIKDYIAGKRYKKGYEYETGKRLDKSLFAYITTVNSAIISVLIITIGTNSVIKNNEVESFYIIIYEAIGIVERKEALRYCNEFNIFIEMSVCIAYIISTIIHCYDFLFGARHVYVVKINKLINLSIVISVFGTLFLFLNKIAFLYHPLFLLNIGCFLGVFMFFLKNRKVEHIIGMYLLTTLFSVCVAGFSGFIGYCIIILLILSSMVDSVFAANNFITIIIAYNAFFGFIFARLFAAKADETRWDENFCIKNE